MIDNTTWVSEENGETVMTRVDSSEGGESVSDFTVLKCGARGIFYMMINGGAPNPKLYGPFKNRDCVSL